MLRENTESNIARSGQFADERPLAIDLFCGLGGWAEGLLAENWRVVGFDIERHVYGAHRYPSQLVLQDVLTLHGSQFRDAALIVASPPCQEYSYMAMPWRRAKAKAAAIRADESGQMLADLNRLFDACFRIGAEASLAAGRKIPLIVENVRGAQPWVGRARWNYGSYYLWGDVPALMPFTMANRQKFPSSAAPRMWRDRDNPSLNDGAPTAFAFHRAIKNVGGSGFAVSHNNVPHSRGDAIKGIPHLTAGHWTNPGEHAIKGGFCDGGYPRDHPHAFRWEKPRSNSSSTRRKMASAMIARIPLPLARHVGRIFYETRA